MPYYVIKAIDDSGRQITKTVEAENEVQLLSFLDYLNLTPIKISTRPEVLGKFQHKLLIRRIKRRDLIDLFENLHLLAQSGVPLGTGLWDLAEDVDNPAIREMLHDVSYRVQSGQSLSKAMGRYEDVLGPIAVNLIRIGEETGTLDRVFKDISEHYARIEEFVSKTKQALIYPAFALTAISFALIFWLVYVLPKLANLFESMNVELPALTVFMMNLSEFVREYIFLILVALVISGLAFSILRKRNEKFRYFTDKVLINTPIVGNILRVFNYAFFSEYMRLMITSGVSLLEALEIIENSFNNRVFKKAMRIVREFVSTGGSISGGLRKTGVFPSLMVRMVSVGEETGALDEQLEYLSKHYHARLDYITQNLSKVIEPLVIIVVGLFMAIIMLSLLMPVYDLISQIGRQL